MYQTAQLQVAVGLHVDQRTGRNRAGLRHRKTEPDGVGAGLQLDCAGRAQIAAHAAAAEQQCMTDAQIQQGLRTTCRDVAKYLRTTGIQVDAAVDSVGRNFAVLRDIDVAGSRDAECTAGL